MADLGTTITDIRKKIDRERIIINGARSMFSQTDNPAVQNRLKSSIHESERNINYLTERLKELELKARPQTTSQQSYGRDGGRDGRRDSAPPIPPPKDGRMGGQMMENGRGGYDAYGQRASGGWQQPGPGIPIKSRNYTKLDLIKYDTPHTAAKIQHMLQQLEFKLTVEQKYKEGMEKMVKLYQMEGDRKARAETESKRAESAQKIVLLKQALKRYGNLDLDIGDEDQRDDDSVNAPNMRRPLTGKLIIRVSAVKDVDHATTSRFTRSPETFIVIKIEDIPRQKTKSTRTDKWNEEYEIPVDKANEIEFTVYDKVADQSLPIGFLWVRISDIAEELRRKRIEQEVAGSGWVSAEKAQAGGPQGGGGGGGGGFGRISPTRGEQVYPRQGDVAPQARSDQGVEAWFALEPAGQILLTLNFVKETRGKRPFEKGLGRQGAIRQRKEEMHEIYGHKFIMQQFYQIMRCALCGELLKNAAGYQCEDCKYTCHKKCYSKVVTKCISKTNAETDPDEEKLNHRIPHRFEPLTNISANWCCHCGYILPLGKKHARKCTECGLTCHAQCTHLVPDFCGMSMEMANNILAQIRATKNKKASSSFAAANLSDRTFRPQGGQVKRKELPTAARVPSFIDDPDRREEINVQAQTLYQQQQQQAAAQQIQDANRQDAYIQSQREARQHAAAAAHSSFTQKLQQQQQQQQVPVKPPMSQTEFESQTRFKREEPPLAPARQASAAAAAALGITPQQQAAASGYSPVKQSTPPPPWQRDSDRPLPSQQQPSRPDSSQGTRPSDKFDRPPSAQSMDSFQGVVPSAVPRQDSRDSRDRMSVASTSSFTGTDSGATLVSRPTDVFMPVVKQPIPAVVQRQKQLEQQQLQQQQVIIPVVEPVSPPPMVRKRIGLEDFNFLAVLGKGNFGKVMLAEAKKTRQLYAIKVLKKEFIVENDEVESTRSEKRVFLVANKDRHPFLLNLHSCFQTETRIYFVMEYISGGDLMLQIQRESFKPRRAQFYAAEILLALQYLHDNKVIYRDLKLDNILLTLDGHIKIADYGLCKEKMGFGSTTNTFCGTPEFMAPEILLEQRYGRAVDWWAFGVLLYQMLLATSPFRGDDEDEIFDAILSDEPLYPIHMPRESVSILQKLLTREPERRLGSGERDALEVMEHPYFKSVNFDDIYHKRVPPPFIPQLSSATDTSNFDQEFTREVPVLTPVHSVLTPDMQEQFRGFSFVADPDTI